MSTNARKVREARLLLRLFVAGDSPNSVLARHNLRTALADVPVDEVRLEIIDVLANPERALQDRVLVTPTLVRVTPTPERRVVGTLRDVSWLRATLGVEVRSS